MKMAKKKPAKKARPRPPKKFHLDKRAAEIATQPGDDDELLSTAEAARLLGVSNQWLEIGRHRGYGPPFERLAAKLIRYRRGTMRSWLRERTFRSTEEYA